MTKHVDERGFTLIEMVLSTLILTVIIGGIAVALFIGLRTTDRTTERLAESHGAQLLATYLVPDLQSVGQGLVETAPSTPAGCAGVSWGTNLLRLQWNETTVSTTRFTAEYRLNESGTGSERRLELRRYSCHVSLVGDPGQTASPVRELMISMELDPDQPPVVTPATVTPTDRRISVRVTERSGYNLTITGDRRSAAS